MKVILSLIEYGDDYALLVDDKVIGRSEYGGQEDYALVRSALRALGYEVKEHMIAAPQSWIEDGHGLDNMIADALGDVRRWRAS